MNSPAYRAANPVSTGITPLSALYASPQDYGALADGQTDDTAALLDWVAALNNGAPGFMPPGVYCTSQGLRFVNPVSIARGTTVRLTAGEAAAGTYVMQIDFTGQPSGFLYGAAYVDGLTLDGMGYAADGLDLRGVVASRFSDISVVNVTANGIHLEWAQTCLFLDPSVSQNQYGQSWIAQPLTGIMIDGAGNSSDNTIINCNIDNVADNGICLINGGNNVIINGTCEACGAGITLGDTSGDTDYPIYANSIIGMDLEANSSYDVNLSEKAEQNDIIGLKASSAGGVYVAGTSNTFHGGWCDHITFASGSADNHCYGFAPQYFSTSSDAGNANTWAGWYAASNSPAISVPDKLLCLSSAPTAAVVGGLYYNTGNNKLYFSDGTSWHEVTSA